MLALDDFTHEPRIAYFSMEIALQNDIPTYSGGLGVLAGDTMRSATDLELPVVAVTLVSRAGDFRQRIDAEGRQKEEPMQWQPADHAESLNAKVAVIIEGRVVWISAWLYTLEGHMNGRQPIILLDTDVAENSVEDRQITDSLYGGDSVYRLKQEIVLGIGGVRLLQALGFKIRQYHMNEGHSALLGLELLRRFKYPSEDLRPGESPYNIPRVRELCCFTTHTPVEAGHDRFSYELLHQVLNDFVDIATLKRLAGDESLNMTCLALNLSEHVNGVAKRHAEISRKMFPGYRVKAITNGVHPYTWTCPSFAKIYDHHLPGWCHEPELLVRADCCISDEEILEAHQLAKTALTDKIETLTGATFDRELPTFGFARRMTAYKRPDLLFSDIERLQNIAHNQPFQIVLAGKAHPNDDGGKQLIEMLHHHINELDGIVNIAFLPGYDMDIAQTMVAGVDVWLNTPLRPMEASGTSGMKAAFNGVPNLSVLDGWWIEGCIEGITGWAVGDNVETANGSDALALYDKLEQVILPLYRDPAGWVKVMKGAICKNASFFNSHRMMRRYTTEAYIR
ncbi:Glycogen phosphorylase [hydrothermal vent metagenome]|uniref:Glycogen phosphorylase n=1 Tax=hydrothermal vent metagenome TaxID=652676 RepID=A0A3B1AZP7_9ZZZZ